MYVLSILNIIYNVLYIYYSVVNYVNYRRKLRALIITSLYISTVYKNIYNSNCLWYYI